MKEPGRLVHEHPSSLARSLLSAGRAEEPEGSLLENTLMTTIGLAPLPIPHPSVQPPSGFPPSGPTAVSASAAGVKGTTVLAVTLKWVGIASVGGALTISGVRAYDTARPKAAPIHQPLPVATKVDKSSGSSSHEPAVLQSATNSSEPAAAPSAQRLTKSPSPAVPPAASVQALLSEEARVIDDARASVARGDGSEALRLLDVHRRKFERPRLRPEALYLRMQALRLQGNIDAAARIAERLLADYPNGTQSAAARALLNAREP